MAGKLHLDECQIQISSKSDKKYGQNLILNISFGKKSLTGKKVVFYLEFYFSQRIEIFAFWKTSAPEQLILSEADVFLFFDFLFSMQK